MPSMPPITVTPRGLLAVALLGSLVAALFGAVPLAVWVNALPQSPATQILIPAADAWRDFAQRVHLDGPYYALRRAVRDAEAARIGN